jgi:hypothetical protein
VSLALGEAHQHGIVHRDVKPENVMVERDEQTGDDVARVCDFGIAKLADAKAVGASGESLTGRSVIGTPHYMAPEQASGEKVDGRADLYAMGCVLYELLSGSKVFEAETVMQVLMKQVTGEPEPLSKRVPGLPSGLDPLVLRVLSKEREARPQTAEEFVEAIDALGITLPGRILGRTRGGKKTLEGKAAASPGGRAAARAAFALLLVCIIAWGVLFLAYTPALDAKVPPSLQGIVRKLARYTPPAVGEPEAKKSPTAEDDAAAKRKAEREAADAEAKKRAEQEAADAEAKKKADAESARLAAEKQAAEDATKRLEEEKKQAAELRQQLEDQKKAAEEAAKKLEAEKLAAAEEAKNLEEKKRAEAELAQKLDQQQKAAAEAAKKLEEQKKAEAEAARRLEDQRKAEAEAARKLEAQRADEAARQGKTPATDPGQPTEARPWTDEPSRTDTPPARPADPVPSATSQPASTPVMKNLTYGSRRFVAVGSFWMQDRDVTAGEYLKFLAAIERGRTPFPSSSWKTRLPPPGTRLGKTIRDQIEIDPPVGRTSRPLAPLTDPPADLAAQPLDGIIGRHASDFAQWAGARLPTAAEASRAEDADGLAGLRAHDALWGDSGFVALKRDPPRAAPPPGEAADGVYVRLVLSR